MQRTTLREVGRFPVDPISGAEGIRVSSVGAGWARARVRPERAAAACDGHFPGDAIVPGASLVGLMAELAAMIVDDGQLAGVESSTFRRRVHPDAAIIVVAERTDPAHVEAHVEADGVLAAVARLRYRPIR